LRDQGLIQNTLIDSHSLFEGLLKFLHHSALLAGGPYPGLLFLQEGPRPLFLHFPAFLRLQLLICLTDHLWEMTSFLHLLLIFFLLLGRYFLLPVDLQVVGDFENGTDRHYYFAHLIHFWELAHLRSLFIKIKKNRQLRRLLVSLDCCLFFSEPREEFVWYGFIRALFSIIFSWTSFFEFASNSSWYFSSFEMILPASGLIIKSSSLMINFSSIPLHNWLYDGGFWLRCKVCSW